MNHANAPSKAVNVKYLSIKVFILMHYITWLDSKLLTPQEGLRPSSASTSGQEDFLRHLLLVKALIKMLTQSTQVVISILLMAINSSNHRW
jgi:hypothetical protein